MAEFEIAPDKARHSAGELKSCSNKLKSYGNQVESTVNSLRQLGDSTEYIKTALRAILEDIRKQQQEADDFSEKLKRIVTLYQSAEKEIGAYAQNAAANSPQNGGGSGEENPWDYFLEALYQAVAGDFADVDGNLLGTVLSVVIGFVPYAGQIADVRDLVADIYHLIDDGPTTEEWVALGFTVIGILPGVGDALKHGDEVGDALKALFKNADYADEAADLVKNFLKKGDDVVSAVGKKIDDFNKEFKNNIGKKIDDFVNNYPAGSTIKDGIEQVKNAVKNNKYVQAVDEFLDKTYTKGTFEISGKKVLEGIKDEWIDDFKENVVNNVINFVTGKEKNQEEPMPE